MLYHLLEYIEKQFDVPGAGLFQYLSFRSVAAIIIALLIGMIFGKKIINVLARKQIGEDIRNLGLQGQMEKKGTPTMGGLIILGSLMIPVLLVCDLGNIYVQLMIFATVWLGLLGFADAYIKVLRKHKEGLKGKFKVIGQVGLGIIVGTVMCFSQQIVVVEKIERADNAVEMVDESGHTRIILEDGEAKVIDGENVTMTPDGKYILNREKNTTTTIPFIKDNEFDYHWLFPTEKPWGDIATWIFYILVAIFIITWIANAANLTDGLDGLSGGVSA